MDKPTVAVLGGGVAGLSAAHELIARDFDVTVYEAKPVFGGKARSIPVPHSGTGHRADLPAEHGFRFFPGFYWHIIDTMREIPVGDSTAADHLTDTSQMMMARAGGLAAIVGPTRAPKSWDDLQATVKFLWKIGHDLGIPLSELIIYLRRMLTFLGSCDERREGEFEKQSWWEFTNSKDHSKAYQKFVGSMTSTLVAARADRMSARTGGLTSIRLLFSHAPEAKSVDRVLSGPTSDVWINPWVAHLKDKGVHFRESCVVAGISCDTEEITGVTIQGPDGPERIHATYYVAALPVEQFRSLVSPEMRAADPWLKGLDELETSWMNGAMFYLREDKSIVNGHIAFVDSEWALTAISQKQFWKKDFFDSHGDESVRGIMSVDISEWRTPGTKTGKVAMHCSVEEIREEVQAQIVEALGAGSLDDDNIARFFLDPDIVFPNPSWSNNLEPLLINTTDSLRCRPDADTNIPNLFLASDYVRTFTDLATMEAANEAARRAVNAILHRHKSSARPCDVQKPPEPAIFEPARELDRQRWKDGHPAAEPLLLQITDAGDIELIDTLGLAFAGTPNPLQKDQQLP